MFETLGQIPETRFAGSSSLHILNLLKTRQEGNPGVMKSGARQGISLATPVILHSQSDVTV